MITHGKRLKLVRAAVGINQQKLATKCSVSKRTIQKWEGDENPYPISVVDILLAMGVNPLFIVCGSGDILMQKEAV